MWFRTAWSEIEAERGVTLGGQCSRISPGLGLGAQHWILR